MPAAQLLRTAEALADLDAIWDYIATDNPTAADRLLDELQELFILLSKNPGMGELQPLLADGSYRRFVLRNYVIYFKPWQDGIVIVRVLHGARNVENLI